MGADSGDYATRFCGLGSVTIIAKFSLSQKVCMHTLCKFVSCTNTKDRIGWMCTTILYMYNRSSFIPIRNSVVTIY